jgi:hypothetical protein
MNTDKDNKTKILKNFFLEIKNILHVSKIIIMIDKNIINIGKRKR